MIPRAFQVNLHLNRSRMSYGIYEKQVLHGHRVTRTWTIVVTGAVIIIGMSVAQLPARGNMDELNSVVILAKVLGKI